jgi:ABC-type nitrate/sulfonate/bicarbonate transport system substrate-binding protein
MQASSRSGGTAPATHDAGGATGDDRAPPAASGGARDALSAPSGAYVAGSDAPERTDLTVGFMPLTDSASLVAAAALGFDRKHGIRLRLVRLSSWATVRDKVSSGQLDAAQMLYGMVYGIELGIDAIGGDMAVLMTLNRNGQGITLANAAHAQDEPVSRALGRLRGDARGMLGHTFRTGTHAMWLYYWLAAHGIDPFRDLRCITVPPPRMVDELRRGEIVGGCVGEPWNAVAIEAGVGHTVATSQDIWPDHPEKALAARASFVAECPNAARALVTAVLDASRHVDRAENRGDIARLLAQPEYVGTSLSTLEPRLRGDYDDGCGRRWSDPHALRFHDDGAVNFPYLSDATWFMTQHVRWGLLERDPDYDAVAARVQRIGLYREAAAALGIAVPSGATRASRLLDGKVWDGRDPARYARSFGIGTP